MNCVRTTFKTSVRSAVAASKITITIVHGCGLDGKSPRRSWRVQVLLFTFPSSSTRHGAKTLLKICRRENLSAPLTCTFRPARSSTSKKLFGPHRTPQLRHAPPCQSTVSHLFANNQPAKRRRKCSPDLTKPYSTPCTGRLKRSNRALPSLVMARIKKDQMMFDVALPSFPVCGWAAIKSLLSVQSVPRTWMLQETTNRAVLPRGAWTCVGRTTRSPSPLALPFTYSTVFHRLLERMSFALATRASLSMLSSSTSASTAFSLSLRCSFALSRCPDSVPRASSVLNSFCDIRTTLCQESLISRLATSCRVDGPHEFGRISGQPLIFLRALFEQI